MGHSLGGGLASAASVATGIGAQTFNAAGLHSSTLDEAAFPGAAARYLSNQIGGAQATIDAYYVDWDLLSFAQDMAYVIPGIGGEVSAALGRRHILDGPYDAALTISSVTIILGTILPGGPFIQALGGAGVLNYMVQAHSMDTMMWSILGEEISGYDL